MNSVLLPASKFTKFLKDKLFNTIPNSIISIVIGLILYFIIAGFLDWAVFNAVWVGESREVAVPNGATWAFIVAKFRFFMFGFYAEEQTWRILLYYALVAATLVPLFISSFKHKVGLFSSYIILWPLLTVFIVSGGVIFPQLLPEITTNNWGGLSLTIILSLMGLLFSFPLALIVALGRRSNLKVISGLSRAYIEFFRGIPLITILFMSSVVVPFFLPPGVQVDKMLRVIIGMSLFQSAYLAEVFRGGLQAIPKGQYEAADSLGMNYFHKTALVIMPQVLRSTISNIGGVSISFVKDTTLVLIIGLFDLLGIVDPTAGDPHWLGMEPEGLIFAGLVYWLLCYIVSKITRGVEKKAHTLPTTQEITVQSNKE